MNENDIYNPNEMNGEQKFLCRIWGVVAIAVVCIIISFFLCNMYGKHLIADVVKSGVNPIDARLAIEDGMSSEIITSILSKKLK